MAAPPTKSLSNLNGTWIMSKHLSDPFDAVLSLQGVSWFKRKALAFASITINVRQFLIPPALSAPTPVHGSSDEVTQIEIEQFISPGGLKNRECRILNWEESENDDDTFGLMKGRSKWLCEEDEEWGELDEWLREGWLVEGKDGPLVVEKRQEWILSTARNEKLAWSIEGVWGFQEIGGERYYCRKLVTKKGDVALRTRLVYAWVKEHV